MTETTILSFTIDRSRPIATDRTGGSAVGSR